MSEVGKLVERMKKEGWSRLQSVPHVIVVPGYHEALAESEEYLQDEERQMARDRVEAQREVAQAIREEYGNNP